MRVSHRSKVAAVATAVVAVIYIVCVTVLNLVVSARLAGQDDERLAARLTVARHDPGGLGQPVTSAGTGASLALRAAGDRVDADATPVFLWSLNAQEAVTARSPGAPPLTMPLAAGQQPRDGLAVTADLGTVGSFRLKMARAGNGWLVAGQSLAGTAHTERLLVYGEVIAGPFVLIAVFGGSLVVGLRALAPVEQSRRRQLEFTADASHELRTPLSVIMAEADVALAGSRVAAEYRDALAHIQGETRRLRQLVDDMLWLARFDSQPPSPGREAVDLVPLAQACADRFRAVGPAVSADAGLEPALISAPPEWIDRLAGVLMDNACRHAGPDGQVRIRVRAQGSRVRLIVEDSGPGIPEADRPRLFDRFHRANKHGSGAGLGLAIGDSIVRSTGGRWHIGDSSLGGALIEVSWRHSQPHRLAGQPITVSNA